MLANVEALGMSGLNGGFRMLSAKPDGKRIPARDTHLAVQLSEAHI